MTLSGWIERQADFRPDKCAIRFNGCNLSYAELASSINRLADALKRELGHGHGDRIAYLGLNSPEMIVLLFACARIGAILVPMNWRLADPEHIHTLNHSKPGSIFVMPGFVEQVENIRPQVGPLARITFGEARDGWISFRTLLSAGSAAAPGMNENLADPVLLCYTSGTTGKPKGALLTKNALVWNAVNATHMHNLTSDDVILTVLPMFHVGGLDIQTLPALHAGATVVIQDRFDADAFYTAIEQDGITLTLLVPTVVDTLINDPRWESADFSRLRMISVGSTVVPEEMVRTVGERGVPLVQVYGSTETAPIAAYMPFRQTMRKPASTGKPAMHCEIRLVDESGRDVAKGEKGEILVRGPNVMAGYWNDPEATDAAFTDGWFHTEDVAHFDDDGFLYVDGRIKDMIICGGENIYPAAIEEVLKKCPELSDVAVIGRPDDHWGEVVVAVVVAKGDERDANKIIQFCEGRIAHFETPREVVFVDELPRNAMGKVVKEALHESILSKISPATSHAGS